MYMLTWCLRQIFHHTVYNNIITKLTNNIYDAPLLITRQKKYIRNNYWKLREMIIELSSKNNSIHLYISRQCILTQMQVEPGATTNQTKSTTMKVVLLFALFAVSLVSTVTSNLFKISCLRKLYIFQFGYLWLSVVIAVKIK